MFESFPLQAKGLTYSLAIREETKDMFIAKGICLPGIEVIFDKIRKVFVEEYGSGVVTQMFKCTILSGSEKEEMDGIMVSSN